MKEISLAVIGSGSTYCPELIDGFIRGQDSLKLKSVAFMDIDERKRTIVGNLCVRMLNEAGIDCDVVFTDDLDLALQGADFVVTQIRVGKLAARHLDETIPLKYGFIGQETTGIGGFFKALRTIPVMQNICERIEAICPEAWLVNFTNPSGIISEFIENFTKVKHIGLCNVPINMIDDTRETAGDESEITYLGLNHLSWITSVKVDGKNILPKMMAEGFSTKVMENIVDDGFSMQCLKTINAVPSSYLQYYYARVKKLEHLQSASQSRAEECMDIEEQLLEMYADEKIVVKPALLDKRGGHKYSLAAVSLIDAIANDTNAVNVVNIKNENTLPFMDKKDIVEIAAKVGKNGAVPIPVESIDNRHIIALMRVIKEFERYTVKAAMSGSVDDAMNAMLIHPLIGDWDKATKCFEEMRQAHKKYLPQFD